MNYLGRNLIFCTTLLSVCAAASLAYAAPSAAGASRATAASLASKAQTTNTSATDAAAAAQSGATANSDAPTTAAGPTQAASPCQVPTLMDSWYMGFQFGYGTYRIHNSIDFPFTLNPTTAASNGSVGLNLGYGKMLTSRFYLGAEAFIVANTLEQSFNVTTETANYINEISGGPTYGLGLLPGIKLTPETLTYIRLGWNRVVLQTYETAAFTGIGTIKNNSSKINNSFVFGVGMETLIFTNYSLRGEFDHMFIGSYKTGGFFGTTINPATNQYTVSIIYHM